MSLSNKLTNQNFVNKPQHVLYKNKQFKKNMIEIDGYKGLLIKNEIMFINNYFVHLQLFPYDKL